MRTPAAAIAWEFRQRHRWGLMAVMAMILTLGAIKIVLLTTAAHFEFSEVTFAFFVPVPLAASFMYLLAVFTFGISGDIGARESMYPPRMLTLPVSSAALAGWPMLYGCIAMALLWFAVRVAGIFPPGFDVPRYWPALFAASLAAWTQALTWMPYPLRGMRIAIAIALMTSIDVVVFTALQNRAREDTMLFLLAPLAPLAFIVARSAVRRARRGDVPDWGAARRFASSSTRSAAGRDFRSAAHAQLWFEWRQYGRSLPLLVSIVLPAGLSLLFVFHQTPAIVIEIVMGSLLLPPFMAIFAGAVAGKSSSNVAESYGITPFLATLPICDRAFVVAKWQAALLSTFATWLIVVVAVPVALIWSDATAPVMDVVRNVHDALGQPRAILLGLVIVAALLASTWKQLVQGLCIAMSGSDRAVKGLVFTTLALVTLACFALAWISESRHRIAIAWSAIPWAMEVLVALKLVLAIHVMRRCTERGLFTRTHMVLASAVWDACVLALFGILAFLLPEILFPRYVLLIVALLVVPFVRLIAAPLAVVRNRHR